ncbi:MAG: hypothetical protein JXO72_03110 [Vicinamibacteria bacterium]|nr:hypothetical protein [Vicinamibacteria bacterium]
MRLRPLIPVLCFLAMLGCTCEKSVVSVTVTPNPIVMTGFAWGHGLMTESAEWTVVVSENGGCGGRIESVSTTVRETETNLEVGQVITEAFSDRLEANSSVAIAQEWRVQVDYFYRPARIFFVSVRFKSDDGTTEELALDVPGAWIS